MDVHGAENLCLSVLLPVIVQISWDIIRINQDLKLNIVFYSFAHLIFGLMTSEMILAPLHYCVPPKNDATGLQVKV